MLAYVLRRLVLALPLLLLLAGQPGGQYGVKDSASDGALPPLPATPAPSGG